MRDDGRSRAQLIAEIEALRQRVAELDEQASERRQAESELGDGEEAYRSFTENFQGIAFQGGMDFVPLFFHGAVEDVTGYEEDDFLAGDPRWDQVVHPDDLHSFIAGAEDLKGIPDFSTTREYRILKKNGEVGWVSESVKNICDESGKPILVQGAIVEITKRKRAEAAYRESEENLAAAQKIAQLGSWAWDVEGEDLRWSEEMFSIFGVEMGTPPATEDVRGLILPEDVGLFDHAMKSAFEGSAPEFILYRITTAGGINKWLRSNTETEYDGAGNLLRMFGTVQDVTELLRVEEERRQSEERFRTVVEQSTSAIEIYHPDGRMLLVNDAWARFWDLKKEDVDDFNIFDDPQCEKTGLTPAFREAQEGRVLEIPDAQYDPDESGFSGGRTRWISSRMYPIMGLEGNVRNIVLTYDDITERKQAEEDRLSLERQIQHAQKLESLGVLAGGIAHDFNNILMAVLGNAELARDRISPHSPARDNIEDIVKAGKRAAELANQMLAYSGRGRFVIESVALEELVGEMAHLLDVSISKKVVLKYNFAANLPTFDGDVAQVRQIIMNLITNGSEAIGDRSGVVALSTGAMHCDRAYLDEVDSTLRAGLTKPLEEGIYVYLEVADTGSGMDKETVGKIFDPFFTTKFTGRGLGLSATLGILRGHSAAIKVYSEVDRGTTVKVLFPANDLPENGIGPMAERVGDEFADWTGKGVVLIADDEDTVCAVGTQMLERMGFQVLTASDGREAVEAFRAHAREIVCVLLDMTMPHLDGEHAFREMRRIQSDVQVILCSGYNMEDATQRFAGKGLAGFLQKPYSSSELKRMLKDSLS